MQSFNLGELKFFKSALLERAGAQQGIFTRLGGVSPHPWQSLNLGGMVGDAPGNIVANRQRCFAALGRDVASLYDSWLVHGTEAVRVETPRPLDAPHVRADIILTDRPEITLMMRFADCVPILLYDPVRRVAGLAHAGWLGTVRKVGSAAVNRMVEWYGCHPEDIVAVIGPSICQEHYPVGEDVTRPVRAIFGPQADGLIARHAEKEHLDLWKANQLVLHEAGVEKIEVTAQCTACHPEEWFSHRAEHGRTGRFAVLLALGQA